LDASNLKIERGGWVTAGASTHPRCDRQT